MESLSYEDQVKALSKISKAIANELYLDDVLRLIVTVTAEAMGSNICSISLIDEKNNQLVVRATQSMSAEYNEKPPLKLGEGIAGKVAQSNKYMVIVDIKNEKEYKYHSIAKKAKLASLLCVPLAVKGKVIGVLNCYTARRHEFTENEIDVILSIAAQAAVAIENAELMVKSRVIQEELESRKKIERAKGILMIKDRLTEEEAYKRLKKYSMDRRKSMREISEAIILVEDIKKEP